MTRGKKASKELTDVELELLNWISLGKTNEESALILKLRVSIIAHHAMRINQKLNVYSRAHAVRVAIERGLLVVDIPKA